MKLGKIIPMAFCVFLFPGIGLPAQTLNDCFLGYKKNDLELQQLQVAVKRAENSLERAQVENGTEVSLSTGNIALELNSEATAIESAPEATVSVPSINGTSITASVPLTFTSGSSGSSTEFNDAEITISTDIISNTATLAALEIENAEREFLLARRDAYIRHISVEESFWNEVRSIYEAAQSLAAAKTSLYTAQSDFDEIAVEGYAPYSSTYISAQLEVNSAERAVKEDERLLANALGNFAVECGMENDALKEIPPLPAALDSTELLDMKEFSKQSYIDLEESIWTNAYNEKTRLADMDFSLSADLGYGWDGTVDIGNSSADDMTYTVITGLSATYKGLSLSAGVSTPLDAPSDPSLVFSLGWDLTDKRTSSLDDKDKEYERQLELIDIETAEQSYEDDSQSAETDYGDLVWTRQENRDNLVMYKKLYEDSVEWSEKGLIADSDLAQNKNSYEQAQYTASLTSIDYVLYNLQIAQYFIDSEDRDYTGIVETAAQAQTGE